MSFEVIDALPPASAAELDRAVAVLAERATPFARLSPREKAALLRAAIPKIRAVASEMVALTCHAAGVDATIPLAGAAWLAGPVALVAGVRRLAEALDDVTSNGRPDLPVSHLRGRLHGRVVARLEPRGFAERSLHRGAPAVAVFAEGVEPEDVISGQAAFYRKTAPEGSTALVLAGDGAPSAGPLRALDALFVEGKVALLETSPARAWLGPLVERALAPLVEAGFLRVVQGGERPGAHLTSVLGEPLTTPCSDGPVIVVPALYATDELWFVARRIASEIAAGAAFGVGAPREIVVAGCWPQRRLFVEHIERALSAARFHGGPWTVASDLGVGARLPPRTIGVLDAGCDDPLQMLSVAVALCNARGAPADGLDAQDGSSTSAEMVVHVIHEEDAEIAAALERATVGLRAAVVGINQWPALVGFRGDPSPRMLARVDKVVVRGSLRTGRRPAYAYDDSRAAKRGARMFGFQAGPSVTALRGARA